jgi:murein L,D-transpeptidase YcbB/YkuD
MVGVSSRLGGLTALSAATFLVFPTVAQAAPCGDVGAYVDRTTAGRPSDTQNMRAFYAAFDNTCAWDASDAAALVAVIDAAADHGLDPDLFHANRLIGGRGGVGSPERDVLMTDAALKYAVALARGLSAEPPARVDLAAGSLPHRELIDGLTDAVMEGNLADWFDTLPPKTETYDRLKGALAVYRAIVDAGGWERLPAGMSIKGKRNADNVLKLRQRLTIEGDLEYDSGFAKVDGELREALRGYQQRNSLRVTGDLDAKTINRLNISAPERVAQIAINLDRLRVTLHQMPDTRVEVNAPAATAALYRDGKPVLTMNAVVGAPGHDTPMLTSKIDTVVINPQWNIPQSIIQKEIKPLLKRKPDYLEQNRMYWNGEQLIQEPGPHNALGRIKFEFPNRYSVYLHDTPARKLFTDPERAQSHGCVRLEKPIDLAVELLRDSDSENWDREAIEEAIRDGATKRVPVPFKMPVVITYQTVFVAEDGQINFRPDVYGLDTKLTVALSQRAAAMKSEPVQW